MATLNGNNAYLTIGGNDVSAYWVKLDLKQSVNAVDVTAGAGAAHVERAAGLKDTSGSLTIVYDDANVTTHLGYVTPGTKAVIIYGPEGNSAGKPKHEQEFLITDVSGPSQTVEKDMIVFDISLEGSAAPVTDIYAGGAFS